LIGVGLLDLLTDNTKIIRYTMACQVIGGFGSGAIITSSMAIATNTDSC